jgi:DNA-binding transcriptional ArsR family regulator
MPALPPDLADRIARRFRSLAEPVRLQLLYALLRGERNVGELVEATGGSQANVSKHLQLLYQEGVVTRRKDGTSIYYQIADPMIFDLCDSVCAGLGVTLPRGKRR